MRSITKRKPRIGQQVYALSKLWQGPSVAFITGLRKVDDPDNHPRVDLTILRNGGKVQAYRDVPLFDAGYLKGITDFCSTPEKIEGATDAEKAFSAVARREFLMLSVADVTCEWMPDEPPTMTVSTRTAAPAPKKEVA